ncbi:MULTISPECIES: FAD-binding oxidoreductase [Myroides]|uniref:Oxidoreductase n=1 Tax=Myroides albus TaxID=2562892 RepID=A0A6I3LK92_9FLAO|nr:MULTISPECIES: FAD-binding oxidoreductase [Myroides]MTG98234.1 oxidoreductase [Myroides albus]MVX35015.1 oxidoreductase [Myroides sp. LoEW2-1]UVD79039.1 FAD-binding oxidoreductase [Myroides albus]
MPKIPKLIGTLVKTAWSKMFIEVTVSEKEQISDNLLRIRFKADIQQAKYEIGQAILMQISETEYRNYTPSEYNREQGYFDVLFHQQADGPGTRFFKDIQVNDKLTSSIPRGQNVYDKNIDYHFFYGDESCIGFCLYLQQLLNKDNKTLKGILEVNDKNKTYIGSELSHIEFVEKSLSNKAQTAIEYIDSLNEFQWNRIQHGQFYIMGNAKSISKFKKALRERGVSNNNIVTQPFWVEGKVGL